MNAMRIQTSAVSYVQIQLDHTYAPVILDTDSFQTDTLVLVCLVFKNAESDNLLSKFT